MNKMIMAAAISLTAITTTMPAQAEPGGAFTGAVTGGVVGAVVGGPVGLAVGAVSGAFVGDRVTGPNCYIDDFGRQLCR
jgi:uncharacterized protein YcfJ